MDRFAKLVLISLAALVSAVAGAVGVLPHEAMMLGTQPGEVSSFASDLPRR